MKIIIRINSKVKCCLQLYSQKNWEFRTICQLATCDDRRPRTGLDLPPYTVITHSVKRWQSVELPGAAWHGRGERAGERRWKQAKTEPLQMLTCSFHHFTKTVPGFDQITYLHQGNNLKETLFGTSLSRGMAPSAARRDKGTTPSSACCRWNVIQDGGLAVINDA
ncbi:hypothetical protein TNCV_1888691 [Trichonephila clavipes]|nr:hypothetical protein TNCV_1888691 [Trichonephila clavipes]